MFHIWFFCVQKKRKKQHERFSPFVHDFNAQCDAHSFVRLLQTNKNIWLTEKSTDTIGVLGNFEISCSRSIALASFALQMMRSGLKTSYIIRKRKQSSNEQGPRRTVDVYFFIFGWLEIALYELWLPTFKVKHILHLLPWIWAGSASTNIPSKNPTDRCSACAAFLVLRSFLQAFRSVWLFGSHFK